jgi:hypothetical protein
VQEAGETPAARPPSARIVRPGAPAPGSTGLVARIARWRTWSRRNRTGIRAVRSGTFALVGLLLALAGGFADPYVHRGVETGGEAAIVAQGAGRELAVNVDLTRFDPSQIPGILSSLQTSGVVYLRQPFDWGTIETREGVFDYAAYDAIVEATLGRGMQIVAVLAGSPDWALSDAERAYIDAPPQDRNAFGAFVANFSAHYGGRIRFFQLWDRPNSIERWGGAPATAADYLTLIGPAFNAVRTNAPDAQVVLAELDPYGRSRQPGNDISFLRDVYDLGGAAFFDIVAIELDGSSASPHARTVDAGSLGFARAILAREIMIAGGDASKPLWATRYGWNMPGRVDEATGSRYLVEGIERARSEWPWMGPLFLWSLLPNPGEEGYALLTGSGAARQAFVAISAYGGSGALSLAPVGFTPMSAGVVTYEGNWQNQTLDQRVFRTTGEQNAAVVIRFEGTGIDAVLRIGPDAGDVRATLDGKPLPGDFEVVDGASKLDLDWYQAEDVRTLLGSDLDAGEHELRIFLAGDGRLTVGGFVVTRRLSIVWPIIVLVIAGLALLAYALRDLVYLLAERWGHLDKEVTTARAAPWSQLSDRLSGRRPTP